MKAKNRYYSRSRITEAKFRQIIRFFAMDFTASDTAKLTNISVRSINTIYIKLRKKIAIQCEEISPFNGIVELDESYFGARRIRGKRGRGASGKPLYLGYSNEMEMYIQKLCLIAPKPHYKGLYVGILSLIQSSIQMDGEAMMV
jgi:hypothetical protein